MSQSSHDKIQHAVSLITSETEKLGTNVSEINGRTQDLVAFAEEIAASADVIVQTLDNVKRQLENLTN